ncbi:hypothetical protein ABEV66_09400 [Bacillus smithii]
MDVFVYGILDLFDFAKRVQKKALCLEIAKEVLHAGIVQTVSFPGYSGPYDRPGRPLGEWP